MTAAFRSRLAEDLDRFLEFKRALGCTYIQSSRALFSFDRYAAEYGPRRGPIPVESLLRAWLGRIEGRKPVTISLELGILRQFLRFRRRFDPEGFIPGRDWGPGPVVSHFVPYVLSIEEVRAVLASAKTLSRPPFRAKTFRAIVLILYCTGLRPGEAVRLRDADVDLRRRTFLIRETKGKTRFVPFGRDLARELATYRRARERSSSVGVTFLRQADGRALGRNVVWDGLRTLFNLAGVKRAVGRAQPRPFDFRHTFAVHRLTRWYRAKVDLHSRLPWLSAYMGHENLLGTETYLTATPELISIAGRRFAAHVQAGGRR